MKLRSAQNGIVATEILIAQCNVLHYTHDLMRIFLLRKECNSTTWFYKNICERSNGAISFNDEQSVGGGLISNGHISHI